MMKRSLLILAILALMGVELLGCSRQESTPTPEPPTPTSEPAPSDATANALTPAMLSLFAPLPEEATPSSYQITAELVDLGRMLYYDERLSINQEMSCNTCHPLSEYGADSLQASLGHDGEPLERNSPTVYNAAFHIAQFWDGRSPDVEDQAKGPITSAAEMGMPDPEYVNEVLRSIPGYGSLFEAAFPDQAEPVNFDNAAVAIGAFERRLVTPSRFDRFLEGDESQLTDQEKRGLATFITLGCTTCHAGTTLGGQMYMKMGLVEPFEMEDPGRFDVTGQETDKHVFKVPSLRNIAETGPYMHNGSVQALEEMVHIMAKHQLAKEVSDEQVADVVAFLKALTGEIPQEYIAQPELPASGPDTPSPETTSMR